MLSGMWDVGGDGFVCTSQRGEEKLFIYIYGTSKLELCLLLFFIFYNLMQPNLISGGVACRSYQNIHLGGNDSGKVAESRSSHLSVTPPPRCLPSFFFSFLRPPSTLLIGRQAARAPVSVPPRAAVPLSPPRWMQGGRMPSQLAGESESFIDSAWPREERTYFSSSCGEMEKKKETGETKKSPCFILVMFMCARATSGATRAR